MQDFIDWGQAILAPGRIDELEFPDGLAQCMVVTDGYAWVSLVSESELWEQAVKIWEQINTSLITKWAERSSITGSSNGMSLVSSLASSTPGSLARTEPPRAAIPVPNLIRWGVASFASISDRTKLMTQVSKSLSEKILDQPSAWLDVFDANRTVLIEQPARDLVKPPAATTPYSVWEIALTLNRPSRNLQLWNLLRSQPQFADKVRFQQTSITACPVADRDESKVYPDLSDKSRAEIEEAIQLVMNSQRVPVSSGADVCYNRSKLYHDLQDRLQSTLTDDILQHVVNPIIDKLIKGYNTSSTTPMPLSMQAIWKEFPFLRRIRYLEVWPDEPGRKLLIRAGTQLALRNVTAHGARIATPSAFIATLIAVGAIGMDVVIDPPANVEEDALRPIHSTTRLPFNLDRVVYQHHTLAACMAPSSSSRGNGLDMLISVLSSWDVYRIPPSWYADLFSTDHVREWIGVAGLSWTNIHEVYTCYRNLKHDLDWLMDIRDFPRRLLRQLPGLAVKGCLAQVSSWSAGGGGPPTWRSIVRMCMAWMRPEEFGFDTLVRLNAEIPTWYERVSNSIGWSYAVLFVDVALLHALCVDRTWETMKRLGYKTCPTWCVVDESHHRSKNRVHATERDLQIMYDTTLSILSPTTIERLNDIVRAESDRGEIKENQAWLDHVRSDPPILDALVPVPLSGPVSVRRYDHMDASANPHIFDLDCELYLCTSLCTSQTKIEAIMSPRLREWRRGTGHDFFNYAIQFIGRMNIDKVYVLTEVMTFYRFYMWSDEFIRTFIINADSDGGRHPFVLDVMIKYENMHRTMYTPAITPEARSEATLAITNLVDKITYVTSDEGIRVLSFLQRFLSDFVWSLLPDGGDIPPRTQDIRLVAIESPTITVQVMRDLEPIAILEHVDLQAYLDTITGLDKGVLDLKRWQKYMALVQSRRVLLRVFHWIVADSAGLDNKTALLSFRYIVEGRNVYPIWLRTMVEIRETPSYHEWMKANVRCNSINDLVALASSISVSGQKEFGRTRSLDLAIHTEDCNIIRTTLMKLAHDNQPLPSAITDHSTLFLLTIYSIQHIDWKRRVLNARLIIPLHILACLPVSITRGLYYAYRRTQGAEMFQAAYSALQAAIAVELSSSSIGSTTALTLDRGVVMSIQTRRPIAQPLLKLTEILPSEIDPNEFA